MRCVYSLFFALFLSLASFASAQSSLNPLNWFAEDGQEPMSLRGTTASDESRASERLEMGREKMTAGSLKTASRIFKKIIKQYPLAKATAEARFLQASILMTHGSWGQAFDTLQLLVAKHPNYENFNQVIGAQFNCATAHMEGARSKFLWVFPGFRQYARSIREFGAIVGNAPYSDFAPLALMNIALVAQQEGMAAEAIDALDRLINYYPQSILAPDAYYNLATTYSDLVAGGEYDQGSTRQAISYYEDFLVLFPQSSYTGEVESNLQSMENLLASSRVNIGDFYYFYRSNNTAALIFYNEAITVAPDSEAAQQAVQRIEDIKVGVRPVNSASLMRKLLLID